MQMLFIDAVWTDATPTFSLIPLENNCPYIEGIFEPKKKALVLLTTHREDTFQMLPRLDDAGEPLIRKDIKKDEPKNPYKQQRVQMNTYHEIAIRSKEDIILFLKEMTINYNEERINKFFE